jgi:large subunit ribosomal protein L9
MQVILLKDVPKLGRQFEVKNVADGHALNLLFPRGLAEHASKEKVAALESRRAEIAHLEKVDLETLAKAIKKLDGVKVTIKVGKANEQGNLYKGVGSAGVAEALSKEVGAKITSDNFDLPTHLKTVGEHPLSLKVGEASANCTIVVEAGV